MRTPESFFPKEQFGTVKNVSPVASGLSGARVYAVNTETGKYFLRLNEPATNSSEMLTAHKLAAQEGIAPAIVLEDAASGAMITEKANGVSMGAVLAQPTIRPFALRRMAETLARLHAIPAADFRLSDPSMAQSIWDEQSARKGFPDWAKAFGTYIRRGDAVLAQDKRRVFSHNDANPTNLLWEGEMVWMIDWEQAALSHPYMDLAIFSLFAILSDAEALDLLAIQEHCAIETEQREDFLTLLNYARVIYGMVFLRLIPVLTQVTFASRETTPTLPEIYARLAQGKLDPRTIACQALFSAAILRQIH